MRSRIVEMTIIFKISRLQNFLIIEHISERHMRFFQ